MKRSNLPKLSSEFTQYETERLVSSVTRCRKCGHANWVGYCCKYCGFSGLSVFFDFVALREFVRVRIPKRVKKRRTKPRTVPKEVRMMVKCIVCGQRYNTNDSTVNTCGELCRVMRKYMVYRPDGKVEFTKSRSEVLGDLKRSS